jgi:hypothetical protein
MEFMIERQVIRTAVLLASASSYGATSDVVADLREESAHLIALCIHSPSFVQDISGWCEDAHISIERIRLAHLIPQDQALAVTAAILRLQLVTARALAHTSERAGKKQVAGGSEKKSVAPELPVEPVKLAENVQKLFEYIKSHPDVRTKELLDNFSGVFSPRSTKRYLAELLALKVVRRKELEDGGVVYACRD